MDINLTNKFFNTKETYQDAQLKFFHSRRRATLKKAVYRDSSCGSGASHDEHLR